LSPTALAALRAILAPWQPYARPVYQELNRVPKTGPVLLVGNHTLWGVLDVPFLLVELADRYGIAMRSLGDHQHFQVPVWRDLLGKFGVVDGNPDAAGRLLDSGAHVMVFPGGAWEVFKRKGQAYQLLWRKREGFARLALAHGATIVPIAAVGADDTYRIVVDPDEILATRPGRVLTRLGWRADLVPPIVRGVGPTLFPRPERLYFRAGEPIAPEGDPSTLRTRVEVALAGEIEALLAFRDADPGRWTQPMPRRQSRVTTSRA
jgi:1-acyl-sn-glycerol-3-phosphate acyltransferase